MPAVDPISAIMHRITSGKSAIELFLATGGAKDFAEYSRMVGEYIALQKMEGDLNEIEQRYLDE